MRILVIGGAGMLGHKLAQVLAPLEPVTVAVRGDPSRWPEAIRVERVIGHVDVRQTAQLYELLDEARPEVVLNAVGIIKQILGVHDPLEAIAVNAVYPTLLARICAARRIRLIHYSTDCVFTGSPSSVRGPDGYRECDLPDARDLYGVSKLLGEPPPPCLVIRTSILGRELREAHGLIEWFLSQGRGPINGYTRALFTGLPTLELARVTAMILREQPALEGLWHVAAAPIDKHALLLLVNECYRQEAIIEPYDEFYCDRRMDGRRFAAATGWKAPNWPDLIAMMRNDEFPYATHARSIL
jgi:dTDP-4-dehydrorhamnose reductase